ncbi:MAG: sigma 54-interacting transcriptional regulator, partial [bacterium]
MEDLLLGKSRAIAAVRQQVLSVAKHEMEILLVGETGTGKGLLARMIHAMSLRA